MGPDRPSSHPREEMRGTQNRVLATLVVAETTAVELSMQHETVQAKRVRQGKRDHYLHNGLTQVEGWLDSRSAEIIAELGEYQETQGIRGAVGEIGVHHGKLFILLDLLKRDDEASFAVDLFEDQGSNVDRSGSGDYVQFSRNLEKFSRSADQVNIFRRNSMNLKADEIMTFCGPVRLLSVDGGHTAACTLNDLKISETSTAKNGIVIIDDYFNPSWPDVSVGVAQHMLLPASRLRPFAISPNKLYLARSHCHHDYRNVLRERAGRYYLKTSVMYGHEVDTYGYDRSTIQCEPEFTVVFWPSKS